MNFASGRSEEGNEFELNITPLLDVMFLLVIFFAVSTTFRAYTGLSIDLPAAESERIREEKKTVTAVLSAQGEVYVDGEKTSIVYLSRILKDRLRESPGLVFVLQADENSRHGQVVELMDTAKQAGISRLAIATRPKESKTGDSAGNKPAGEKASGPAGDR
jgi:biopolymer transport protein ExbD